MNNRLSLILETVEDIMLQEVVVLDVATGERREITPTEARLAVTRGRQMKRGGLFTRRTTINPQSVERIHGEGQDVGLEGIINPKTGKPVRQHARKRTTGTGELRGRSSGMTDAEIAQKNLQVGSDRGRYSPTAVPGKTIKVRNSPDVQYHGDEGQELGEPSLDIAAIGPGRIHTGPRATQRAEIEGRMRELNNEEKRKARKAAAARQRRADRGKPKRRKNS